MAWDSTKTPEQFNIEQKRQNMDINRKTMWEAKLRPCADCKLRWHPMVMTFDHIDRRTVTKGSNMKNLGSILHYNPLIFNRQLRACSVVCLNCHRVRELTRDLADPKVGKRDKIQVAEYLAKIVRGALIEEPCQSSQITESLIS